MNDTVFVFFREQVRDAPPYSVRLLIGSTDE